MKIEFHYTYIIIAIGFILTGYFSNLIVFTSIIIIHELGHFIIAKLLNLNPTKVIIYPFGGITKMNNLINTAIPKELLVSVSGIVFQSIYYLIIYILFKNNLIREYIFNEFTKYHTSILLFNILPIYPLDGSIFLNLLLQLFIPYKTSMKINILISVLVGIYILYINYYNFNYTLFLIISIIIDNLYKYYKNINYLFNRFLLERYLYRLKFDKIKIINNTNNMYKEKYHFFNKKNHILPEKEVLTNHFKRKV